MTTGSTDVFLEELAAWAETAPQELEGDSEDAALLCDLARDHLGRSDLSELKPGDLRELLLEVFPRKITVRDPAETETVIPTMREVCCFLRDTGRIARHHHDRLVRELDEIEPRFAGAVMDPANWGMARTVTQAMIADGVDIEDPDAAARWVSQFNRREAERRVFAPSGQQELVLDLTGLPGPDFDGEFDGGFDGDSDGDDDFDGEEDVLELPPVRLAPPSELAAAVRACPLLTSARRLAEWLGPSRRLTATGALRLADARAIITEFGLAPSRSEGKAIGDGHPESAEALRKRQLDQLQSARDFAPLDRLWILAQVTGLIDVEGRRARPGPRLEALALAHNDDGHDHDSALLKMWGAALLALLHPSFPTPDGPLAGLLQEELLGLMTALYAAGEPVQTSELAEMANSHLTARLGWEPGFYGRENLTEEVVTALLAGAAEAGAVELASGQVTITPLGAWGVHQILRERGLPVRAIGDYAGSGAAELVTAIAVYDQADGAAELASWLAQREPEAAAAELAAVVRSGTPVQRMAGLDALGSLGAAGRDAARTLLDEPGVGAIAAVWLESVGEDPEVEISPEEALWVLADMGAAMVDTMPPDDAAQELAADIDPPEFAARIAQLWRSDHPRVLDVLMVVADHHEDRLVTKAARKAIFRARTSSGHPAPPAGGPVPPGGRPDRPRRHRKRGKRKRRH